MRRPRPSHHLRPDPPAPTPARLGAGAALLAVGLALGPGVAVAQTPGPTVPPPAPTTAPATAPPSTPRPPDPEPPPLGPLPEIAPALAGVEVTSDAYDEAAAERDRIRREREAATRQEEEETAEIATLTARDEDLTAQIADARRRAERWEGEAVRLGEQVRTIAVTSYINGSAADADPVMDLDAEAQNERAAQDVVFKTVAGRTVADLERAQRGARRARNDEEIAVAIREGVRAGLADARRARDAARADRQRLGAELLEATATLAGESRLAEVAGADFPLVVLDAYWKAAELMRVLAPTCGISWWALAGIGKIESRHGTYGGSEVRADGSLTKRIIGIPLTGFGGTAAIGDSDGGLIDGDPLVDRAAGPMQFIPQTWARWGRDGDADGDRDIQTIYDAAAGAAAYLCASGPLLDDAGLQRAYFSYNRSLEYVASVLDQAKGYAASVAIPPVG